MLDFLKTIFGDHIGVSEYSFPDKTPIYIRDGYKLQQLMWNNNPCVLLSPRTASWRLPTLKKQLKNFQELCEFPCALYLEGMTALQRRNLIENNIPFISSSQQVYLPFWGCSFFEKFKAETSVADKMAPGTQLVFLYLYYLENTEKEFIDAGGYQARQRSNGTPEFYRFVNPANPSYPKMIELFSRPQNNVKLHADTHLMPLHINDELSSLSAILLNDDYYHFLLAGRTEANGISILDAEHIIPLKMKAWLDLKVTVPAAVGDDIKSFIEKMREMEMRLEDIGISRSKDSILDIYRNMYTAENV